MKQTPLPPHPLLDHQRDPRRFVGAAVSFVFHAALLVLIVRGTVDTFFQPPTGGSVLLPPGGGGGGGGGERVRYITLPPLQQAAAPAPVEQPAVPPPDVVPPEVVVPTPVPTDTQPTPTVVVSSADSVPETAAATGGPGTGPGSGGGSGGGAGGGAGTGTGPGSGPGSGGGGGGGAGREPQWTYGTFFFESPPKKLRGQKLRVTFHVRADGRVARVETQPEIEDGDFARKFIERAEAFRFKPARNAEGANVPGVATMSFTLSSK